MIQFQVVVLGFSDSFISCYRDDMALFKIEFHFPFFCPFIKCVKIFLECSCVCLRLKSYIHYGVISKESNCRSNIVWNVVNVKKGIGRDHASTEPWHRFTYSAVHLVYVTHLNKIGRMSVIYKIE